MQKVVGVVGYKNCGKTTLVRDLAAELGSRGRRVTVIKHASHALDLPDKDTARLSDAVEQVASISPQQSMILWNRSLRLEDMLPLMEADIVLVEGFKSEKTFPKVACLRGQPDDADLFDGLVIAAVGPADYLSDAGVPVLASDDLRSLADLVEERGFKLPRLDCGDCGYASCHEMAQEIVAGRADVEQCTSLQPATEVRIDGEVLALNPFISGIVRSTIVGLLSALRGFKQGRIEIKL